MMRGWIGAIGLLLGISLLAPTAMAQKLPSRYDARRDSAMYNGKQNMPYQLWGVAIKWDQDCFRGRKVAECIRLANAFEKGAGDMPADMRVAIAYWLKSCEMGSGPACARAATILRDGSAGFTNPELAGKMADRGCTALKDQASCAGLAASLASAPGGKADPRAAALVETACASGSDDGCRMKANALFWDKGDAASRAQALPMFESACQAKRAWGCLALAEAYGQGIGVKKDSARAAQSAATGCTQGQGDRLRLCTLHGMNLARPGNSAYNKGEQFLDTSCKGGDPEACNYLGRVGLSRVSGATTTEKEGLYYLRRGCDLGYGGACSYLSVAYSSGIGVNQDNAVALALNDKACRLGDSEGCGMAKQLLSANPGLRSRIPAIDPSLPVGEQLRLARAAVESGDRMMGVHAVYRLVSEANEDAEWLFGGWLYYGLDGVFDTSRRGDGVILFENAARVGHVEAAIFMGMAYWYGDGVTENRKKGEDYMAIAANRGSQMAGAIFRSMKNEPVRQEMARRQKAMEEWAATRRNDWTRSWANWTPPTMTSAFGSGGYSSSSSGRSVSSIIDNSNWNQRINYLSGSTTACPGSNPYC